MTSEAREKFERWHARQYELGACRCPECKGKRDRAVAAFVAPDDVAERGSVEREAEAATPAPFDPEGVRRTFTVDSVLRAVEQATDEELRTAGGIEFSAPIEPPAPGEPDQRPYRGIQSALRFDEERKRRAMRGGGYVKQDSVEAQKYEQEIARLIDEKQELASRLQREESLARRDAWKEHSRITYEEARASLEREFGKEAVGQAIDGLTRLLAIRDDVDRLVERSDQLSDAAIDLHEELEELQIKLKSNAKE